MGKSNVHFLKKAVESPVYPIGPAFYHIRMARCPGQLEFTHGSRADATGEAGTAREEQGRVAFPRKSAKLMSIWQGEDKGLHGRFLSTHAIMPHKACQAVQLSAMDNE
jgi:hypothetical protein